MSIYKNKSCRIMYIIGCCICFIIIVLNSILLFASLSEALKTIFFVIVIAGGLCVNTIMVILTILHVKEKRKNKEKEEKGEEKK